VAEKPPEKPQRPGTVREVLDYSKRFLLYGFAISIALHFILGPFVQWKRPPEQSNQVEKVTVTKKVTKVVTPRPTPTPPPSPTPVTHTPPPQTPPPHQVRLKVQPPKTTSNSAGGPSENQYNVKSGSEEGIPQGNAATGPPAPPPPAAPTPTPTPTKPSCANPNADATATQKVVPDMPDVARQMGATGTAQIKVTLDASGNVTGTAVYKSTHNTALDQAALQAAQQSKYAPEVKDCVKVGGSYLYTVTFESQ
jgi:TonB family protein